MKIGLIDVDGHNFPNLALMKISAYHKAKGDDVEWCNPFYHYDIVYQCKVFGDTYSNDIPFIPQADKIIKGGTGYAIEVVDGKEIYHKELDKPLPYEIEHIYPDYNLYEDKIPWIRYTSVGFLTRGCCNDCSFCIVSNKEGRCSHLQTMIVKYISYKACFSAVDIGGGNVTFISDYINNKYELEVIGNIHDNPELLKEAE